MKNNMQCCTSLPYSIEDTKTRSQKANTSLNWQNVPIGLESSMRDFLEQIDLLPHHICFFANDIHNQSCISIHLHIFINSKEKYKSSEFNFTLEFEI